MPPVTENIKGRAYWRSLSEHADSPAFREMLGYAGAQIDPSRLEVSRRRFLQVMGASMSLAGLTLSGCRRWPESQLAPFSRRPEGRMPGEPVYYASQIERGGVANGLIVESFDGRPIKIEGNPAHPYSQGATDAWTQASLLNLYDPDRSRFPKEGGGDEWARRTWEEFAAFAREHFAGHEGDGEGVAVLMQPSDSPTLRRMQARFEETFPQASWYEWEPVNRDNALAGAREAFGAALRPIYRLDEAETVGLFDADPLYMDAAAVRQARDWAKSRKRADSDGRMSRVYAAEASFTVSGSVADERLPARPSEVPALLEAVAARLGVAGVSEPSLNGSSEWVEKLVRDLREAGDGGLVMVGERQPAAAHALAWAINDRLGALGRTVELVEEPHDAGRPQREQIGELAERMRGGQVQTLLILGGNPVYDAPADLDFGAALEQVGTSIHLSDYYDETSRTCGWHVNAAHYLESWGDGRAWDGTVSVQQPLILPLFDGRSPIELLSLLLGEDSAVGAGRALVKATFEERGWLSDEVDSEKGLRRVLHDGVVDDSGYARVVVSASEARSAGRLEAEGEFELIFRPDTEVYDGRWANNGWLQETPGPITKLTWDNAALMSVADAREMGLSEGDFVGIEAGGQTLELPVFPTPGQKAGTVVVQLGYGRTGAGQVGDGVGADTYRLRRSDGLYVTGASIQATGQRDNLATTQEHHLIDAVGQWAVDRRAGRQGESGYIVREMSLDEYRENPDAAQKRKHGDYPLQLFQPPHRFNNPHAWGMTVDMNACIGCNACLTACQAENNVPVVGKDEVNVHREMHWIRIDRYFKGDPEGNPDVVHQPMMCVHCENAPCEQVCPVNAAIHDSEGLNLQVYNRCIGTRYCSNNCPYKVRRFNFFDYHSKDPRGGAKPWLDMPDMQLKAEADRIKAMVLNPDVTVRMRGVMEKCTYCMQRLTRAKIAAKNEWVQSQREDRPGADRDQATVKDGEVQTACQQVCPTQAIVFGDLNDGEAEVTRLQQSPRAYRVLHEELNTRPRTRHLAKVRNRAGERADA